MKELFNKIKSFLSRAFGSALEFLVDRGQVAVKVTNIVKSIIENPGVSWAVELTPTKSDDLILAKAKKIVPEVAVKVALAMSIIQEAEANADQKIALAIILDKIRYQLPEDGKGVFYRELSGRIAEYLMDGNLSTAEAVAIVQLVFKKRI